MQAARISGSHSAEDRKAHARLRKADKHENVYVMVSGRFEPIASIVAHCEDRTGKMMSRRSGKFESLCLGVRNVNSKRVISAITRFKSAKEGIEEVRYG
jgi:hypothetical protein